MNTAQKILKNTLSLLLSGLLAQFLSFVTIVYLARVLAPEDFGKVSFALAMVTYFTLMVNMGLPILGTRETARDLGKIRIYAGNILTMRLCLAAFSLSLLMMMAFFLNKSVEIKYLIILYGLGLIPSALLLDWAFQGVEKMEYIGIGRILSKLVYLGLVLWFVKSPKQLLFIPCFQVVGSLLSAGVLFFIFLRGFGKPKCGFDLSSWKSLLKPALPIGASLLMIQIIYNIDMVMLGFMRSDAEIGYYSAAYKIILPLIMAGAVYFDAIFPVISNYYNTSLNLLKKIQSYSARLIVSIALPLGVGGTILAKPIMNFVYGSKYNDGIIAFKILIWVVIMIYMNCIYARGMWACNKQKEYLIIVTIQALTNIGLNLILIPSIGITGAAISTVAVEILGFFFYYREFNKVVTVTIHNHVHKPLLAVIPMALGLLWGLNKLNMNMFLLIFTGIIVYFFFLLLLKDISRNEIKLIYSLLNTNQRQK